MNQWIPSPYKNYSGENKNGVKVLEIDFEYTEMKYKETNKKIVYYTCICPICNIEFKAQSSYINSLKGCKKCSKTLHIKNTYIEKESFYIIEIEGTINGKIIVDKEDYSKMIKYKWYIVDKKYPTCKAYDYKNKKVILMSKMVTGYYDGELLIDHINGNTLDNRRENLRLLTHKDNMKNRRLHSNSSSGVSGVHYIKKKMLWEARISNNNYSFCLGFYKNKEDAIKSRLEAESFFFGELSRNSELFKTYNIDTSNYKSELDFKSNDTNILAKELGISNIELDNILNKLNYRLMLKDLSFGSNYMD